MFFGDAVGFRWWDELWLSESFATYFEHGAAAAALAEVMMVKKSGGGNGGGGGGSGSGSGSGGGSVNGGGSSSSHAPSSSPPSIVVNFFDAFFDSTASVGLRAAARSRSGHALSARFPASALHSDAGIESMFDRVEYEHGAAVLRMLRSYMNAGKEEGGGGGGGIGGGGGGIGGGGEIISSSSAAAAAALDDAGLGGGSGPDRRTHTTAPSRRD